MRKSQVSIEYLLVLAISFMMLIPGLYFVVHYASTSTDEILSYQVAQIGSMLVDSAQTVDGYGTDGMLMVDVEFPSGITNLTVVNYSYVLLDSRAGAQFFRSRINITAAFLPDDFSQGKKRFRIESRGDYVSIARA